MFRKGLFIFAVFFMSAAFCFGQAGLLRDYVGLISIHYHPDAVAYMGKFKDLFERKGYTNASRAIDTYLKGLSGSGFSYVAQDGTCYILTNEHVIAQSQTLSVTFEKQDGAKTTYDNLKVLRVDEENDLAILYFDSGAKPFTQALSFSIGPAEEGGDVFAAGFPGLGNTAIWQFSAGKVSNAAVRLPKDETGEETIVPYIQHTAQIDPGNSGGPLLVAAAGVPTGYAVAGINTLSAVRRQAANYAIPVDRVRAFIDSSLSKEPINEREAIERKANDFVKGLGANRAVYGHIAKYISNACTASNAEYAISELLEKAPRTVLEDVDNIFSGNPVEGMNAGVAWLIENSMRTKSGVMRVSLDSIVQNGKGGFDVSFMVNGTPVKSEWVKEYGVYRMETYGDIVTGDKSVLEEKRREREQAAALRTDYSFTIGAGYAYVAEYGSAINAFLNTGDIITYGLDFTRAFGDLGYTNAGFTVGLRIPVRLGSVGILPFAEAGWGVLFADTPEKDANSSGENDFLLDFDFCFALALKGGIMVTTSAVPGLFGRIYGGYTIPVMDEGVPNHVIFGVGIGYGF